jgi:hypothetical protein
MTIYSQINTAGGGGGGGITPVTGSWTPTYFGGSDAGTTSYNTQTGSFIKLGPLVMAWGTLNIGGASGSGGVTIGALPYPISNGTDDSIGSLFTSGLEFASAGDTYVVLQAQVNTSTVILVSANNGSTPGVVPITDTAVSLAFQIVYQTSS